MKRLGDYIEAVSANGGFPYDKAHRPFNNATAREPPLLRPRGVNRILLFPGSFNPPHKGHLDLLTHVFHNAGDDLHITAAIILMTDDEMITLKTNDDKDPLVLTRQQRVNLWRGTGIPVDWAWVYEGSQDSWKSFREQLEAALQKDDIELKFILLGGPDWINSTSIHDPDFWGCVDAITSDVSRPVDFRSPSALRQLSGCTAWKGLDYDKYRLERQITAKLRGRPKKDIENALQLAIAQLEAVSICRTHRKPSGYIRFLPCNLATRPAEAPSSTDIRHIISTCDIDQLQSKLSKIALNPPILINYVSERTKDDSVVSRVTTGN